jgi:two-component system sensor histidine kinase KdpD
MANASEHAPPTQSGRLLVCIDEAARAAGLVRHAARFADALHLPWSALYIETARSRGLAVIERDRIADTLRLTESLGATASTIPSGERIADDILAFARANHVVQIVIGKPVRSGWLAWLRGSVADDLLRRSGDIAVLAVSGAELADGTVPRKTVKTAPEPVFAGLGSYATALGATAAALGLATLMRPDFGLETVPLVFLMAVIGTAYLFGLGPSLLAALAGMLCYNFFFLPPFYTFTIADPTNVAALVFFLFTALAVSNLTASARRQAEVARSRAAITDALYAFARTLASIATMEELLHATATQIAASLRANAMILLPGAGGKLEAAAAVPAGNCLDAADLGAAQWALRSGRAAGHGADALPGAQRLFLALRTSAGVIGVVGLGAGQRPDILLTPDERRLVDALMDQAAIAIERVRLAVQMDEARIAAEAERLRGALLTSLSHDLKTPLTSILGAANSLREYGELFDARARADLVATIEDEAARMSRFVANLLDMTRLEAGALAPKREPSDIAEIIGAAVHRVKALLTGFRVEYDIAPDLPLVEVDVLLMEQVLINLLDNAAKYAPPGSTLVLAADRHGDKLRLRVIDEGPGIPEDRLEKIFDKFHRVDHADRQRAGTGLGLAICRGFVEAMGGTIRAANRTDRSGAIFTVALPVSSASAAAEAEE